MKIVVIALLMSSIGLASERANRWKGFSNPNKIEKNHSESSKNAKLHKKVKKVNHSSKIKYKSVSL